MSDWLERHQAERVARGLPPRITDANALTVLASVLRAANARTVADNEPEDSHGVR